ncbi:MAG: hypothetical protein ACJ763_11235 [Bdellovibrionia bacterium]
MLQKYSFFCVFALLLTGLHWWSLHINVSTENGVQMETTAAEQEEISQADLRRELLESMDRLVILENYYHSVYGHYTQVLNHAGFSLPARLSRHYEIRVMTAAKNQFQASAFAEERGKITDRVWVDQLFRVTANFPIPAPSAEYLKFRAAQHLNALRDLEPPHFIPEYGIYTGYFRYEIRRDSGDRPVAVAIGVQSPVAGIQLESEPKKTILGESREVKDPMALPNLSGEVGNYAKEWSKLAEAADHQYGESTPSVSLVPEADRRVAGLPDVPPSDQLIIESITK